MNHQRIGVYEHADVTSTAKSLGAVYGELGVHRKEAKDFGSRELKNFGPRKIHGGHVSIGSQIAALQLGRPVAVNVPRNANGNHEKYSLGMSMPGGVLDVIYFGSNEYAPKVVEVFDKHMKRC